MVDQLFRPPLLAASGEAVNYHNAVLPSHRGFGGPEFCVYQGERRSGFTFHRMIEGLDEGPILLPGFVAVAPGASADAVERAKTELACAEIDALLDAIVGREPGTPQGDDGATFTKAEVAAIRAVGDGSGHSFEELERRLRAFGVLELTDGEATLPVTALRRSDDSELASADGVRFEATRILHLRPSLFRLYRSAGLIWLG
jgi:methionyl-tRNA formyltransferase